MIINILRNPHYIIVIRFLPYHFLIVANPNHIHYLEISKFDFQKTVEQPHFSKQILYFDGLQESYFAMTALWRMDGLRLDSPRFQQHNASISKVCVGVACNIQLQKGRIMSFNLPLLLFLRVATIPILIPFILFLISDNFRTRLWRTLFRFFIYKLRLFSLQKWRI